MNKLTKTMLVVLIATVAIFSQIPNNGLVAWFPFTGNYNDESENKIELSTVLTPPNSTTDRNGVADAAYEFNGSSSGFGNLTPAKLPLGNPNLTISAWIYAANSGIPRVITSWGTDTVGQNKEIVFYHANNASLSKRLIGITNGVDSVTTELPIHWGEIWLHVAVTVNSGNAKFYINGTPSAAQSIAFNIQDGAAFGIATDMTSRLSGIGYFGGKLDDIAIYNRALTDQEITYIKNSPSTNNKAPSITSTAITAAKVLEQYNYTITTSDPENDTVTVTVPVKPSGMSFSNNKLTWTPTETQSGDQTVTIIAKDKMGDSSVQTFTITVNAPEKNTAPEFKSSAPLNAKVSKKYIYDIEVNDAENDTVTLYLLDNPTNMELNGTQITWTPKSDQTGDHLVTIVAKDTKGDSSKQSFKINVEPTTNITHSILPIPTEQQHRNIFYLPNGRICQKNFTRGLIVNRCMKRIIIK